LGCEARVSIAWANNEAAAWGAAAGEGSEMGRELRGSRLKTEDFFLSIEIFT